MTHVRIGWWCPAGSCALRSDSFLVQRYGLAASDLNYDLLLILRSSAAIPSLDLRPSPMTPPTGPLRRLLSRETASSSRLFAVTSRPSLTRWQIERGLVTKRPFAQHDVLRRRLPTSRAWRATGSSNAERELSCCCVLSAAADRRGGPTRDNPARAIAPGVLAAEE